MRAPLSHIRHKETVKVVDACTHKEAYRENHSVESRFDTGREFFDCQDRGSRRCFPRYFAVEVSFQVLCQWSFWQSRAACARLRGKNVVVIGPGAGGSDVRVVLSEKG